LYFIKPVTKVSVFMKPVTKVSVTKAL
jgi:hypothetical protein